MPDNLIASNVGYSTNDKELIMNLYRKINELVYIINTKDTGIFNDEEILTSQQWYVGKGQYKKQTIYRKAFKIGALPNTNTINVPHNINITEDWDIIKAWFTSKDPVGVNWITDSYPTLTFMVDDTYITIITSNDLSAYTDTRVIIEYTKS